MPDAKEIIGVIKKILTDLSRLDDAQLAGLFSGSLKFRCEPAERKTRRPGGAFDEAVFEKHKNALLACSSRADAMRYLENLKMKVADLKGFAQYLGLKNVPASGKDNITKAVVDQTIGFRLDAEAVYRT